MIICQGKLTKLEGNLTKLDMECHILVIRYQRVFKEVSSSINIVIYCIEIMFFSR